MEISVGVARAIVAEISKTVNRDVNVMNLSGRIIASTDVSRVGTHHVGAQKIIEEKLETLAVCTGQEYSGTKVGINMPVFFKGEIAGVLGISGEWSQISQYIPLIRKATEALLMDDYLQAQDREVQQQQKRYVYQLLCENPASWPEDFLAEGLLLKIDLSIPRRAICFSGCKNQGELPQGPYALFDALEEILLGLSAFKGGILVCRERAQLCVLVPTQADEVLQAFAGLVLQKAHKTLNRCFKAGVDNGAQIGANLRVCKMQAEKSVQSAISGSEEPVVFYQSLTFGLFVSELSDATKQEYLLRVFGSMTPKEQEEWIRLLEVFYACDGSITQSAQRLFLHKNTLQYQLKKLAALTGYDPRSISTAGLYQTAISFWKSV